MPQHDPARALAELRVIAQVIAPARDGHRFGSVGYEDSRREAARLELAGADLVERFLDDAVYRKGKPLAVSTVVHTHAILRRAFRDAVVVDQLIDHSPVERAKRPRVHMTEPGTVWTPAQLRTFLAVARRHRLFAFFHVAAYTGARRGELLNLRWADVDLDGKQITITGSAGVVEGERLEGTTKSGKKRIVSIDDETVKVLREHHKAQSADKLAAGDSWRGEKNGHVFATSWGEPVYPDR